MCRPRCARDSTTSLARSFGSSSHTDELWRAPGGALATWGSRMTRYLAPRAPRTFARHPLDPRPFPSRVRSQISPLSSHHRRYSHGCRPGGHIAENDGVGANFGVLAYGDPAEDFGPGSDVDVPRDVRHPSAAAPRAHGDLLKEQAIGANLGVGMNDHPVGMGEQRPPSELHRQRDFDPRYDENQNRWRAIAARRSTMAKGSSLSQSAW